MMNKKQILMSNNHNLDFYSAWLRFLSFWGTVVFFSISIALTILVSNFIDKIIYPNLKKFFPDRIVRNIDKLNVINMENLADLYHNLFLIINIFLILYISMLILSCLNKRKFVPHWDNNKGEMYRLILLIISPFLVILFLLYPPIIVEKENWRWPFIYPNSLVIFFDFLIRYCLVASVLSHLLIWIIKRRGGLIVKVGVE